MRRLLAVLLFILLFVPASGGFVFASTSVEGVDTYCYEQLKGTEQLAYEAIHNCLIYLIKSWNCGSFTQTTIQKAYNCLLMDHPEIYWSEGYTYVTSYVDNRISGHRVEFTYSMTRSEIEAKNMQLEDSLFTMAKKIGRIDASYETVKAVYEYLINNSSYEELNLDQSMCSVMLEGGGVCASFAKAFEFIMQCMNIPCTVVYGRLTQSSGMLSTALGHEWNLVRLGSSWYHVDVTSGLNVTKQSGDMDYRFLCASTDDILKTHIVDNPVELPSCTDTSLNFFTYYGLTVDTYSREAVAACMLKAYEMGLDPVVRFSNYRAFSDAVDDLFTKQGILQAVKDAAGISFQSIDYRIDEPELTVRLEL